MKFAPLFVFNFYLHLYFIFVLGVTPLWQMLQNINNTQIKNCRLETKKILADESYWCNLLCKLFEDLKTPRVIFQEIICCSWMIKVIDFRREMMKVVCKDITVPHNQSPGEFVSHQILSALFFLATQLHGRSSCKQSLPVCIAISCIVKLY